MSLLGDIVDNCVSTKLVLTVWGEKGSLLGLGAEDTMKTSSAPRSSSVNPLQERSTSAFWEMSMEALTTEQKKYTQDILDSENIPVKAIFNGFIELYCWLLKSWRSELSVKAAFPQSGKSVIMCKF